MPRLVRFLGGPCDGLECRADSADRYESAVAVVWSLFRIGCGGPLDVRQALHLPAHTMRPASPSPHAASPPSEPAPLAHYRIISHRACNGTIISVAAFTPIDRDKT